MYRQAALRATILNSRFGIKRRDLVTAEDLLGIKEKKPKIASVDEMKLEAAKIVSIFSGKG
jgi:hypothetical protein